MLRHWVIAIPAIFAAILTGCGGGGGGGTTPTADPSPPSPQTKADLPGLGGGIVIADLFEGAVIHRTPPQLLDCRPGPQQPAVPSTSPVVLTFSESIDTTAIDEHTIQLRARGGDTVAVDTRWYLARTVAVLLPQGVLRPSTDYEVVLRNELRDLTGHHLFVPTGKKRLYRRFKTGPRDEGASVLQVLPLDGSRHLYRATETLAVFDAPVRTGDQSGSIEDTGNYRVIADGTVVGGALRIEGGNRIAVFAPGKKFSYGAQVEVDVSHAVRSESGRELLDRGRLISFQAALFASPKSLTLPDNSPVTRPVAADGYISNRAEAPNLHQFKVKAKAWPTAVSHIGVLFVDRRMHNGFRFEQSPSNRVVDLAVDLQPQASQEALSDGIVLVGAYSVFDGVEGPIDVVHKVYKDTDTFTVTALGPPNKGLNDPMTLYTTLRRPSIYGEADQPSGRFAIEQSGTGATTEAIPALSSQRWSGDQTTFDDGDSGLTDAFLTAPWPQDLSFEMQPHEITPGEGEDVLGNSGTVRFAGPDGKGRVVPVGVIGATSPNTDGLEVVARDTETMQSLDGTDVIVQPFPPSVNDVLLVRPTPAIFTRSELGSLVPSERLMITLVCNGYHIVSYAGLPNPATSGRTIGIDSLLDPARPGIEMQASIVPPEKEFPIIAAGGNGLVQTTPDQRWFIDVAPGQSISLPVLGGRLKAFWGVAMEQEKVDGQIKVRYRTVFEAPRILDGGSINFDLAAAPEWTQDDAVGMKLFLGRTQTDESGIYDDPADPNLDLVEARLLARLPGFPGVIPVYITPKMYIIPGDPDFTSEGLLLLPRTFVTNEVPEDGGLHGDDSPIELIIQPDLAGSDAPVSRTALREAFWTELVLRNGYDARLVLARSPVDFLNLFNPKPVFQDVTLPHVPDVTSPDVQTHPPLITWEATLEKEGLYAATLVHPGAEVLPGDPGSGLYDRRWTIMMPGQVDIPSEIQFPDLAQASGMTNSVADFDGPFESYLVHVEAYGFDFDDPDDPSDDATVQFDATAYALSELQRNMMSYARSSLTLTLNTTP